MSSGIEIDGKNLLPIKELVGTVSYSRDYITRLARDKKIEATFVGRQWFVDVDSLQRYTDLSSVEQELRKFQLSAERKQEKKIHAALHDHRESRIKKAKSLHARSLVAASFVLGFGLLGGGLMYGASDGTFVLQTVQTLEPVTPPTKVTSTYTLQTATVAETSPVKVEQEDLETIRTIRSLGNVQEGILLLPQSGTSSNLSISAFSDNVQIRTLDDGTEVIEKVDADGQSIGNKIPFVRVPVVNADMPN
jgi:hypothetical protein